jgi:hypothetical protein
MPLEDRGDVVLSMEHSFEEMCSLPHGSILGMQRQRRGYSRLKGFYRVSGAQQGTAGNLCADLAVSGKRPMDLAISLRPNLAGNYTLYYASGLRPVGLVNLFLPRVLTLGRVQNRAHLLISKNFSCLVGGVEPRAGKKERCVGDSVNAHRKMAAVRGICHEDVTMAR